MPLHRAFRPLLAVAGLGLAFAAPSQAGETGLTMPSGLEVAYLDRIVELQDNGETWLTLRYVAPRIGQAPEDFGYEQVAPDLDRLCETDGLPAAAEVGGIDQVVITLMDRAVERGFIDPDATMYIGAYLPTEAGCVWQ